MAVSTAYPNTFMHNSTSILETSLKVHSQFLQPSEVDKTPKNLMSKLPRHVNGEYFYPGYENLAKVNYLYEKHKPEYSTQLEGMECSKSSPYGSKIIQSSASMNREIEMLSPKCKFNTVSVKDASKNVNGNPRLSFGSIPKYLKCFSCKRIVKEDHFCEHLLFGFVKCSDCNETINDCPSFQIWATEFSLGVVSCEHRLSYSENPAEYLSKKISGSLLNDVNNMRSITYFENYVNKLDSLKEQKPWKEAISACKEYMLNSMSSLSQLSSPKSQQKRESYLNNFTSNVGLQQHDEQTGLTITQENDLPTKRSFKKIDELEKDVHDSKSSKVAQRNDLEFIEVPKDGFYYVSKKSIDECPNCYTFLSPYWATVNVNSFLISVICVSCNLTIYITSPKVEIVTD